MYIFSISPLYIGRKRHYILLYTYIYIILIPENVWTMKVGGVTDGIVMQCS